MQQFHRFLIRIRVIEYYCDDTHTCQQLGTQDAGLMRAVYCAALQRHPDACCLYNKMLLGVDRTANFMTCAGLNPKFIAQAADIKAMRQSTWRTVIPGTEDALIPDSHSSDLPAQTG